MTEHAIQDARAARTHILFFVEAILALVALAAVTVAETRSIELREPNPILNATTLKLANVALVLVAAAQVGWTVMRRRRKYKLAPVRPSTASVVAAAAPSPRPTAGPVARPAATTRCASCGTNVRISSPKRPFRFRCPKCGTVGVLS